MHLKQKQKNESGFGLVVTLCAIAVVMTIGYVALSRVSSASRVEKADEIINTAGETIDRASDAGQKAQEILER